MMAAILTEELPDDNALKLSWGGIKIKLLALAQLFRELNWYLDWIDKYLYLYLYT